MIRLGFFLVGLGTVSIVLYVTYHVLGGLLFGAGVPMVMRFGVPAVLVGFSILIMAVVRDRLRASKGELPDEVDH